ncbi:MAG: protein kinase [Chrysiogenetes bacterium]|nr:protein kinase [Chrysiogenetes bacterium]
MNEQQATEVNPVGEMLAQVRDSDQLSNVVTFLREPPGLYLSLLVVGFFLYYVGRVVFGSTDKGMARNEQKKQRRALMSELNFHKKAGNFHGMGEVYERLGNRDKAMECYKKGGNAVDQARLFREMGERSKAKNILETSNEWEELARMAAEDGEWQTAAVAFEESGKTLSAAEAYERAGDMVRAARLYEAGGMDSKAGELLAAGGGRNAAEILERDLRTSALRGKGAAMSDSDVGRLKRCLEIWAKEGEYQRAFDFAKEMEQWKFAAQLAKRLPPSEELAEICMMGDQHQAAAEIYRQIGQDKQAALVLAQYHQQKDELIEAGRYFEEAEEWLAAADLYYTMNNLAKAGELYERAGDNRQAAEMFAAAGDAERAAALYKEAGEYDMAARAFEQLGDLTQQAESLASAGDSLGAGKLFYEAGLLDKAIRMLQQVGSESADYRESRVMLGEIFVKKGDRPGARAALGKALENVTLSPDTVHGYYLLAKLEEMDGNIDEARSLYERVNAESYGYQDVAMRLKAIADGKVLGRSKAGKSGSAQAISDANTRTMASDVDQSARTQASDMVSSGPGGAADPNARTMASVAPTENRYTLKGALGRGGMGVVYDAIDETLKREVAYKALPDDLKEHPKAAKNLMEEARSAARLSHPNIVQVFDAGKDERGYFIVMEKIEGETFDKIIRSRRISVPGVVNIARQICAALAHAHSRHIVHRDLKPSNLFWTNDKMIKLMDFGLARTYDEEVGKVQTRTAGTPYYMAPEQIRGDAISPQTDIYALGCVLYELLCNRPPFTEGELTYHHVHTPPEDPRKYREEVSETLSQIVLKCLEKAPEDRYASADDVSQALAKAG